MIKLCCYEMQILSLCALWRFDVFWFDKIQIREFFADAF